MQQPVASRIPFAKIMVILAVTFGIALGLCGMTAVFGSSSHGSGDMFGSLAVIELIVMLLSAAGLILTAIVWAIAIIIGGSGNKGAAPPKLFDDKPGSGDQGVDKK